MICFLPADSKTSTISYEMLIFDPCLHSIRFILFEEKNSIEGALLVLLFETI